MTRFRPQRLATACLCAAGLVDVLLGWHAVWATEHFFDFAVFYDSAVAWWSGASPYRLPNLNPPYVVGLLSPLGWLSKPVAWTVWQALNAISCLLVIRLASTLGGRPDAVAWALFIAHASTAAQTLMGQIVWVLGVPLVLAWRAALAGRIDRAGLWLGLCLAAKPFLLPVLTPAIIDRRWRRMAVVSLLTAIAIAGVTMAMTGTTLFREWLNGSASAWHSVPQPLNAAPASLASVLGLPPAVGVGVGCIGLAATLSRWRVLSPERQWLAILVSALLVTPLCWIQYTAWLLPLTWLTWNDLRKGLAAAAIGLTMVPPVVVVLVDRWHVIYTLGVVCWLAAVLVARAKPASDARVIVVPTDDR